MIFIKNKNFRLSVSYKLSNWNLNKKLKKEKEVTLEDMPLGENALKTCFVQNTYIMHTYILTNIHTYSEPLENICL